MNTNENATHFDLIVIGAGPGGYVAAIRAAQLGMNVACIERDALGGVCLNWGCIPTKALIQNAEIFRTMSNAAEWGIHHDNLRFEWSEVIARSRKVAETLSKGIAYLFKKNNITHLSGHAKITRGASSLKPCEVVMSDQPGGTVQSTLTADKVLISTGAVPRELPFARFDGKTIITAKEAMTLPEQPKEMVIVGAGAIGVEFAYIYNAFGTKVTLVEMLPQLLPIEDADIAKVLAREFKKSKIGVKTNRIVRAIEPKSGSNGVSVTLTHPTDDSKTETIEADVVLVAIGVRGRFDGLFDDSLGLETFKDHIKVEYREVDQPTYQTTVPGIYAIGDVIGPPWLAHVASEEGMACVERMMGHDCLGVDHDSITSSTYCQPQVASIGKTEKALKEEGLVKGEDYDVGSYQLKAHGKAVATGHNVGLVKILTSRPHGEILGAHIVGDQATEIIGEMTLARHVEATIQDIIDTVHAHPTMHEAVHETALDCLGRIVHG